MLEVPSLRQGASNLARPSHRADNKPRAGKPAAPLDQHASALWRLRNTAFTKMGGFLRTNTRRAGTPPGAWEGRIAGITACAPVVEMSNDDPAERIAQVIRWARTQRDMIPSGLRDTLERIDRLTAPVKALEQAFPAPEPGPQASTLGDWLASGQSPSATVPAAGEASTGLQGELLPAPPESPAAAPGAAVATADDAVEEARRLAAELNAAARAIDMGCDGMAPPFQKAHAALARGLAALLTQPTKLAARDARSASQPTGSQGVVLPIAIAGIPPAVPIINMRAGLDRRTRWTPAQREALLAQVEGHPDWGELKKRAYADVEKAWGIKPSTRKEQLAEARKARELAAGPAA